MNSYLQRKQYVLLDGVESKMQCNTYGTPQGSTVGPLLFLIYFNVICNATQSLPRLFADNACFTRNHSNLVSLNNELNVDLAEVVKWCNVNKLTINPNKCHCMVIPPKSKDTTSNLTIEINNSIIHSSKTVKYRGVIIASKLFFVLLINYIESKLTRANGIISRLKSTLSKDALLKLYYALFQPHLLYGLTIWGTTYPTYLKPLKILQNRTLRNIGGSATYENPNAYYIKLDILKLQDLYYVETAKIVYNDIHKPLILPISFLNYFVEAHKIS